MKYGEKCSFLVFTHQLIISDEDIHQLSFLTSVLQRKGGDVHAGDAPPTRDLYAFNGRINLCQLYGKQWRPSAPAGPPVAAEAQEEKRRKDPFSTHKSPSPVSKSFFRSEAGDFYPETLEQEVEGGGGRDFLHSACLLASCIVGNHPVSLSLPRPLGCPVKIWDFPRR